VLQAQKSQQIEKSRSRNLNREIWWNWLTLNRDRDKLPRFAKKFRSRQISRSRSRLLRLESGVETKLRYLDLDRRDQLFVDVETYPSPVSRSRVSIEITSRQIETPRLTFLSKMAFGKCQRVWQVLTKVLGEYLPKPLGECWCKRAW